MNAVVAVNHGDGLCTNVQPLGCFPFAFHFMQVSSSIDTLFSDVAQN